MKKHQKRGFKRTCFKKKIKSKREAKQTLSNLRKKGRDEIRFYYCWKCKAYHLTSTNRKLIFEAEDEIERDIP